MDLEELRLDCSIKQKKGLHFILTSVIIWVALCIVHMTPLSIFMKNLLTFCVLGLLLPIAFFFSKIIKVDFQAKENPLTNLGVLFSVNQILYILIAMWAFQAAPEKMLMLIAMIFGAHLLPFSWLYTSKSYMVFAIAVPLLALLVGVNFEPYILAGMMFLIEIAFSISLISEIKKLNLDAVSSAV